MSSDTSEARLRLPRSEDPDARLAARETPTPEAASPDAGPYAATPLLLPFSAGPGTASADDLGLSIGQIAPDPLLEAFEPAGVDDARSPRAGSHPELPPSAANVPGTGGTKVDDPPIEEGPSSNDTGKTGSRSTSTTERFAALDLRASPPSRDRAKSADVRDPEDDDREGGPSPVLGWTTALLASYASAVTIGLIWVLWGQRTLREREGVQPDRFSTFDATPDPGRRRGQSRMLVPPPATAPARVVAIGQATRLNRLEVTPLEVVSGPVVLRRTIKGDQTRPGGDAALTLVLRLKNVSTDSILVPLDEAFLREREGGVRDSFIETRGPYRIDMYPLAVISEWSLVGQEFRELGPGESYETRIMTAPGAADHLTPRMTWRVRLRTDINQADVVGIRFDPDDVRPAPSTPEYQPSDSPPPPETSDLDGAR
jgi:hypothetical protein